MTIEGELAERLEPFRSDLDHVIAEKHGGRTVSENLAYSCSLCI